MNGKDYLKPILLTGGLGLDVGCDDDDCPEDFECEFDTSTPFGPGEGGNGSLLGGG